MIQESDKSRYIEDQLGWCNRTKELRRTTETLVRSGVLESIGVETRIEGKQ